MGHEVRRLIDWFNNHIFFLSVACVLAVVFVVWIGFQIAFHQHDEMTRQLSQCVQR